MKYNKELSKKKKRNTIKKIMWKLRGPYTKDEETT